MDIKVRGAVVVVRSVTLTKALLKQAREFKGTPPVPFILPIEEGKESILNPQYVVGWFRGSVLGEEYDDYFLFLKDGDIRLLRVSRMATNKYIAQSKAKQLYI